MRSTQTGIPGASQHNMTKPCGSGDTVNGALQAARVHVLIRGELLDLRPLAATGAGLRPRSKGLDKPPDPTAALAARPGAIRDVIGQKSAEAIVGVKAAQAQTPKGRTRWRKEEP